MKKIFKFIIACFIYLQFVQLIFLVVARLPVLKVYPLGYLLIVGANIVYLWFWSIIYRFRLSDKEDVGKLFWQFPFKISMFVGIKPKLERKLFLYIFILNILYTGITSSLNIPHNSLNDLFNTAGFLSLITFIILTVLSKSKNK